MPHSDEQNRWKESKARNESSQETRFLSLRCQIIFWTIAIIMTAVSCVVLYSYLAGKL